MSNNFPRFVLAFLPVCLAFLISMMPEGDQVNGGIMNSYNSVEEEADTDMELDNYFVIPSSYEAAYLNSISY